MKTANKCASVLGSRMLDSDSVEVGIGYISTSWTVVFSDIDGDIPELTCRERTEISNCS